MCVSLKHSIYSSFVSLITCFILYKYSFNQKIYYHFVFKNLAIFFFFVSLMQWYDTIFWLNQTENNINFVFTKIAMITNHLQPIILALIVYNVSLKFSSITIFFLILYIIFGIIYSTFAFNKIKYTLVTKKSFPVLFWEWNTLKGYFTMYTLFLIVFSLLFLELPYPINYIMLFLNLTSFIFSTYSIKKSSAGKLWCVIAVYAPLLLIVLETFYTF